MSNKKEQMQFWFYLQLYIEFIGLFYIIEIITINNQHNYNKMIKKVLS